MVYWDYAIQLLSLQALAKRDSSAGRGFGKTMVSDRSDTEFEVISVSVVSEVLPSWAQKSTMEVLLVLFIPPIGNVQTSFPGFGKEIRM